jgi:hypothetical protein
VLKTTQAGFGTPGGWSGSLPSRAHSVVYGKGTGQDGILPPIVNRPSGCFGAAGPWGRSSFFVPLEKDRRQKAIVCPTKTIHAFTNRRGAQRTKESVVQGILACVVLQLFHGFLRI